MPDIVKNRTIRPSTRNENSTNYRIDIKGLNPSDTLIVNVTHESKPFHKRFKFRGKEVLQMKSLSFRVVEVGNNITIHWSSTQPVG